MSNLMSLFIFGLSLTFSASAQPVMADNTSSLKYVLVEDFSSNGFFSHFNYETFDDPTHGIVDYVRESRANYLGLLSVDATTGQVKIAVENKAPAYGRGRPAVRLTSKSKFNSGLFIIDVNHIPEGNAVWPAFWSFGPNWPKCGEIDVIEGRNNQPNNQSTLHTDPGCVMPTPDSTKMTGQFIESLNCNYVNGQKGCTTQGPVNSFGPGLNKLGGGVFALLWTTDSISVWHWPRQQIPSNIATGAVPDPSTWGLPVSYFQLGRNCPASNFVNHNLVINTTFCGDWAAPTFEGPTGRGVDACRRFVKQYPQEFKNAYWEINYLRAYSVPK